MIRQDFWQELSINVCCSALGELGEWSRCCSPSLSSYLMLTIFGGMEAIKRSSPCSRDLAVACFDKAGCVDEENARCSMCVFSLL